MFRILFFSPRIAPNTGNAIRMVAATGCELHLVQPLGFDLSEPKLRRAGLDDTILADPHITAEVRIPMLAGRRSLNLSNAAAVAAYEAWRQHGYTGAAGPATPKPQ